MGTNMWARSGGLFGSDEGEDEYFDQVRRNILINKDIYVFLA